MTRRYFQRWFYVGLVALLTNACAGLAGEPAIVATLPPAPTTAALPVSLPAAAPDLVLGAQAYMENCTRCHGLEGRGDGEFVQSGRITQIIDFTDPQTTLEKTPAEYYEIITNGRLETLMPPWANSLNESQRWAAALYTYMLPYTPEVLTLGQALWEANCAECHGAQGEGTAEGAPLPGLLETTNAEILLTLVDGIPDKMPAFDTLSADERQAVTAYARSLSLANVAAAREVAFVPTPTAETGAVPAPEATDEAGGVVP
ncbi:MAG: c-type cytochrome, partial [Anaerolineae bacterium]|nr:c-type cytochrome [Anaerolineae bacterium]